MKFEVKVLKERLALKPRLERYYRDLLWQTIGDCDLYVPGALESLQLEIYASESRLIA
ncbi:hypothetical protein [Pyrobaculum sp.]|uniref:hypothetical protein n=1 Tax=Pyrobaculum sp. TaxID=2004705 RepID=UPI0031633B72